MQQVAAAAGTATFIAIMAVVVAHSLAGGASEAGAYAVGIHTALLLSVPIMSLSIVAAFFVKKAKKSTGAPAAH